MCQGSKENKLSNHKIYKADNNSDGKIVIDIKKKNGFREDIEQLQITEKSLVVLLLIVIGCITGMPLSILFVFTIITLFILFPAWVFLRNN